MLVPSTEDVRGELEVPDERRLVDTGIVLLSRLFDACTSRKQTTLQSDHQSRNRAGARYQRGQSRIDF
jgi:hypothetical protein